MKKQIIGALLFLLLVTAALPTGLTCVFFQTQPQSYAAAGNFAPEAASLLRCSRDTSTAQYGSGVCTVDQVFYTGDLATLLQGQLLTGRFPASNTECVISEDLALQFFFTTEVEGRTFELDGERYTVSGVCRDRTWTDGPNPRIYCPEAWKDWEESWITAAEVPGGAAEVGNLLGLQTVDLPGLRLVCLAWLILLLYLCVLGAARILLPRQRSRTVRWAVRIVAAAAGLFLWVRAMPAGWLPPELLCDVGWYWEQTAALMQTVNTAPPELASTLRFWFVTEGALWLAVCAVLVLLLLLEIGKVDMRRRKESK